MSDDQKKYYNGTLGNLLPLSLSVNSSLQNDCFENKKSLVKDENGKVKRNGYINGSYSEQEVAAETEWGPEQITKRGLKLLTFMEERWGIYFGDDEQKKDILHLTEKFAIPNSSFVIRTSSFE